MARFNEGDEHYSNLERFHAMEKDPWRETDSFVRMQLEIDPEACWYRTAAEAAAAKEYSETDPVLYPAFLDGSAWSMAQDPDDKETAILARRASRDAEAGLTATDRARRIVNAFLGLRKDNGEGQEDLGFLDVARRHAAVMNGDEAIAFMKGVAWAVDFDPPEEAFAIARLRVGQYSSDEPERMATAVVKAYRDWCLAGFRD